MADKIFSWIELSEAGAEDRIMRLFEELFRNITLDNLSPELRSLITEAGGEAGKVDTMDAVFLKEVSTRIVHKNIRGLSADDHTQYLKEKADGGIASEIPSHNHSSADEAGLVSHDILLDVSADDHHPQIHSHSSHTGIGANDHHNKIHATTHESGGDDELELVSVKNSTIFSILGNEVFANSFERVRI